MRWVLGLLAFFLIACMVLAVVAYTLWGAWGLLGIVAVVLGGLLLLKSLGGYLLQRALTAPFKAKGAVLRDAALEVHSVTPAEAPAQEYDPEDDPDYPADDPDGIVDPEETGMDEEEPEAVPLTWYHLDVTITPREPTGPFTLWEPWELTLAGPDAQAGTSTDLGDLEDYRGEIAEIQICDEGRWQVDEVGKYGGPQRLLIHAGVPTETRRVRLRYYFEVFGEIDLTPVGAAG